MTRPTRETRQAVIEQLAQNVVDNPDYASIRPATPDQATCYTAIKAACLTLKLENKYNVAEITAVLGYPRVKDIPPDRANAVLARLIDTLTLLTVRPRSPHPCG